MALKQLPTAFVFSLLAAMVVANRVHADNRLDVWPILNLAQQYRDNLTLAASGQTKADFVTLAIFGLSADLVSPHREVKFDYLSDGQLYISYSNRDKIFHDQYVGLVDNEHFTPNTSLDTSNYFLQGSQVFTGALIGPDNPISTQLGEALFLNRNFTSNRFESRLDHKLSPEWSVYALVNQQWLSSGSSNVSQSFRQGFRVGADYSITRALSIGPGFSFNDFRFSSAPFADSYMPYLNLQYSPSDNLKVEVRAGPLIFFQSSGITSGETFHFSSTQVSPGVIGSLVYVRRRWSLKVDGGREATTTAGIGGAGIMEYVGGVIAYQWDPRTQFYTNTEYSNLSPQNSAQSINFVVYAAGASRRITKTFSIFASYYGLRIDRTGKSEAVSNTFAIGISAFTEPWRFGW